MSSSSTQFATPASMGMYDPMHQMNMWENAFKGEFIANTSIPTIIQVDTRVSNTSGYICPQPFEDQQNNQLNRKPDKKQRRLAQNREAARKSRMRKKAYVQQLETCRLKLTELQQELERYRRQGIYAAVGINTSLPMNPGIIAFEMKHGHWVEENQRQTLELRKVLQTHISEDELQMLVQNALSHYHNLFRMKVDAAKADVFYLMSGMWRTPVERYFLWLGGFRPSELLNLVMPHIEPLTDQQLLAVGNLRRSSQQAEEALSQGMDRLHQTLAQSFSTYPTGAGDYGSQMGSAMEKLEALESFVNQADHLRQQTLRQISRVLTIHQVARGLLAMGEYFQRLRALSSLWAARPRECT